MTLNLDQRSYKVIDFGTNGKRVYIFLLVVNSNLDSILRYDGLNVDKKVVLSQRRPRNTPYIWVS